MRSDDELIKEFASERSEGAFSMLAKRHVNLVYGAALRQTREPELARDVTQQVFLVLAKKAGDIRRGEKLIAWLHRTTYLASMKAIRSEARRRTREKTAAAMIEVNQTSTISDWDKVSPILDNAVEQLNATDRTAILMRFFDRKPLLQVGLERVSRAVDRLRDLLTKQGVKISATGLAAAMTSNLGVTAPAALVATVISKAGASLGTEGFLASLSKLSLMTKAAVAVGIVGVVAAFLSLVTSSLETGTAMIPTEAAPQIAVQAESPPVSSEIAQSQDLTASALRAAENDSDPSMGTMIRLTILDQVTGLAIPDSNVERRSHSRTGPRRYDKVVEQTDSNGVCEFLWPEHDSYMIQITTQIEGYADTRLEWRLDRGSMVPASYTLTVERATPIGGWVTDEDGNAISDATIGVLLHSPIIRKSGTLEGHDFGYITTKSDRDGRWEINRIAEEMIPETNVDVSHPDYVPSGYSPYSVNARPLELLIEKKLGFKLSKGITIEGTVVDELGNPVAGARVLGGSDGRKETLSGADGRFRLSTCSPYQKTVSVEAEGFASTTVGFESAESEVSITIRLSKGRDFTINVFDLDGQAIAGAHVMYSSASSSARLRSPEMPAVEFRGRTDRFGECVWKNAPKGPLQFDIAQAGYMRKNEVKAPESATEVTVDLKPALTIKGSVTDAQSQRPVPRFTIICGWPSYLNPSEPTWSTIDSDWLKYEGGIFEHTFEEPLVYGGRGNPGYVLTFDAEGYESFTSRTFNEDEIEVTLDIELQPKTLREITIIAPDRNPISDAEIVVAGPKAIVRLGESGFKTDEGVSLMAIKMMSDDDGKIQLARDPVHTQVAAIHAEGFARLSMEKALTDRKIDLRRWAALDGLLLSKNEPLPGQKLSIRFRGNSHENPVDFDAFNFTVTTDNEGRFSFPQLPPEDLEILAYFESPDSILGTSRGYVPIASGQFTLEPGSRLSKEFELGDLSRWAFPYSK